VGKDCEEEYIVARSYDEALGKAQEKYGRDAKIYQDPDVLDTWFSRSVYGMPIIECFSCNYFLYTMKDPASLF
jgi:valyl-tRNA synthetase